MTLHLSDNKAVAKRQMMEKRIARRFLQDVFAAGYRVRVDNGEETSRLLFTVQHALREMFETDQEHVLIIDVSGVKPVRVGWVFFVYGNDGWDVIADSSANDLTDRLLKGAEAVSDKIADNL